MNITTFYIQRSPVWLDLSWIFIGAPRLRSVYSRAPPSVGSVAYLSNFPTRPTDTVMSQFENVRWAAQQRWILWKGRQAIHAFTARLPSFFTYLICTALRRTERGIRSLETCSAAVSFHYLFPLYQLSRINKFRHPIFYPPVIRSNRGSRLASHFW